MALNLKINTLPAIFLLFFSSKVIKKHLLFCKSRFCWFGDFCVKLNDVSWPHPLRLDLKPVHIIDINLNCQFEFFHIFKHLQWSSKAGYFPHKPFPHFYNDTANSLPLLLSFKINLKLFVIPFSWPFLLLNILLVNCSFQLH